VSDESYQPKETRQRHLTVVFAAVLILGMFMLMASQVGDSEPEVDGLTAAEDLGVGDCFIYPGDGVEPSRVETVDCSQVHYAEVFGVTSTGNDDACVDLFESYTGVENYWETGYILGFLPFDTQQHCYLYAAEDFAGALAAS